MSSASEWYIAMNNYALTNETGNWELVDDCVNSTQRILMGNASVSDGFYATMTSAYYYRCWLPR